MTEIELFTSSTCPKCKELKERLTRMEIEFIERNTEKHEERFYLHLK